MGARIEDSRKVLATESQIEQILIGMVALNAVIGGKASGAALTALSSQLSALAATIPTISTDVPMAESNSGSAGADGLKVPSDKHQHPRLTATANGVLRTNAGADNGAGALVPGDAVVMFTRVFTGKPAVTVLAIDDNTTNPVPRFKVRRWLRPDGQLWSSGYAYGGCVIYGDRARALPVIAPIGALTLLTALITALNTILAGLSGYLPYEPASGAGFSLIALQQS